VFEIPDFGAVLITRRGHHIAQVALAHFMHFVLAAADRYSWSPKEATHFAGFDLLRTCATWSRIAKIRMPLIVPGHT